MNNFSKFDFERFKKQIETRLNKGEDAESIINESESEVDRKMKAIAIAEIAPEKLIGRTWNRSYQNLYRFFNEIVGINYDVADRITSILFFILDSKSLAKLLNFVEKEKKSQG